MKKRIYFIAAILLVAATTIIVSCKKDKTEEGNTNKTVVKNYELSDMDKAMIAFGEKMKAAANERSGETMPLAEALNTLTNYQNFTMCDASNYSIEMLTDTVHASLNVSEGNVLLSNLNLFYETTRNEILSRLNTSELNQQTLFCIESLVENETRSDLNSITGDVTVDVIIRIYDPSIIGNYDPIIDDTLSWYDFDGLGLCDTEPEGQYLGWDCVRVLNARLHDGVFLQCGPGYQTYYTNINSLEIHAYEFPDTNSPNGRYSLPWRLFWDDPQCVSPTDMAYYMNNYSVLFAELEEFYMQPIIDFHIVQYRCVREENHNREALLLVRLGDINCKPVLPEE